MNVTIANGTPIEFVLTDEECRPGKPIHLNDGRIVDYSDGVIVTHQDGRQTFHDYTPQTTTTSATIVETIRLPTWRGTP